MADGGAVIWGRSWSLGLALGATLLAAAVLAASLATGPAPELSLPFAGEGGEVRAEHSYGELPLAFEPNAGRGDRSLDYLTHTSAGTFYLTASGATVALSDGKRAETIGLELVGASPAKPIAREPLPGVVNDLRGDDPARWRTEIPTFERVRYPSVYPGTALEWHGNQRRLEYDFRLAPGADPSEVALRVRGADQLRLARNGDLVIDAGRETIRQRAPVAYQPTAAGRTPVRAGFSLDANTVSFSLGPYDRSRPLVIDPLVLAYSTYLGGDSGDVGLGIAVDAAGAAYVAGETGSSDFNTVGQIEADSASGDAFVSKLTPAGDALAYSTYLGGASNDSARAIAVDAAGAAYVTGQTGSTDFNLVGSIEGDSFGQDAFVSKLTPAGNSLAYSTYLGGDDSDSGNAIAVDTAGAAYVTGATGSTDYCTGTGCSMETDQTGTDAFISKLIPAGSALAYSTYLGGNASDTGNAIAVDSTGATYVTGQTDSTDFNTVGSIEPDSTGADAFISKLIPAGSALAYSTYLGGDGSDSPRGIAVDSTGAAYVTGQTGSTDFNTVGEIEGDTAGSIDAFISKLTPAGSGLTYSTYLGGNDVDQGNAIALDSAGAAYVAGTTESTDFNTVGEIEADPTGTDAFISKLAPAGSALAYSTYLGGNAIDNGNAIAVDAAGAAYVTGRTDSTDFNTVGPIEGDSASTDAFISKLSFDADADGVPDDADACPTEAGPASNGGCPVPGKAARTLDLDANKKKVTKGKKVRLEGRVEAGDATACESGQTVELQRRRKASRPFKQFSSDQTDASGDFAKKVKVKKTFTYRAHLDESAACAEDDSNTKKVKAKPRPKRSA